MGFAVFPLYDLMAVSLGKSPSMPIRKTTATEAYGNQQDDESDHL